MPELRLTVDADTFEEVQKAAALNEMSLRDVAAILLRGGLEEQRARSNA